MAHTATAATHASRIVSAPATARTSDHADPLAIAHPAQSPIAKTQVAHGTTGRISGGSTAAPPRAPGMASPGP
jgi:hypothetical protein